MDIESHDKKSKSSRLAHIIQKKTSYLKLFQAYVQVGTAALGIITIIEAMKFADLERNQVVVLFKSLEEASLGTYMVGRRTQPTRFKLNISDRLVTRGIQKALATNEQINAGSNIGSGMILHSHALRPDTIIEVRLPIDFTQKDAQRLKSWIDTIPFN